MIVLVHGGHRHGFNWNITQRLAEEIKNNNEKVEIIDLTELDLEYSDGEQISLEEENEHHNDHFMDVAGKFLVQADFIYIITPTYYNMPPAKLKNFIDRSDILSTYFEENNKHPEFAACISGEADVDSIGGHMALLEDYAQIMGWTLRKICNREILVREEQVFSDIEIKKIVEKMLE